VKVLGVCGVGKELFKMRLEELGDIWRGKLQSVDDSIISPTCFTLLFFSDQTACFWMGSQVNEGLF